MNREDFFKKVGVSDNDPIEIIGAATVAHGLLFMDGFSCWIVSKGYEKANSCLCRCVDLLYDLGVVPCLSGLISGEGSSRVSVTNGSFCETRSSDFPISFLGASLDMAVVLGSREVDAEIVDRYLYCRVADKSGKVIVLDEKQEVE